MKSNPYGTTIILDGIHKIHVYIANFKFQNFQNGWCHRSAQLGFEHWVLDGPL